VAKEPVLIYEPDANARKALAKALMSSEYKLYGVKRPEQIAEALGERHFPVMIIALAADPSGRTPSLPQLQGVAPSTALIVTAEAQSFEELVGAVRGGASDYLSKPFDRDEVRERVAAAIQRRQSTLPKPARATGPKIGKEPWEPYKTKRLTGSIPVPNSELYEILHAVQAFQGRTLEVFMEIERRHLAMTEKLGHYESRSGTSSMNRELTVLIAHADPKVASALEKVLVDNRCSLLPQAVTGGKVLDEIGQHAIDVVILSVDLPDIPSEIVARSIRSQTDHPTVLMLRGWDSTAISLQPLLEDGVEEPLDVAESFDRLAELLAQHVQQHRNRVEARKIVRQFKARHQSYIKAMADMRKRIDKMMKERFGEEH